MVFVHADAEAFEYEATGESVYPRAWVANSGMWLTQYRIPPYDEVERTPGDWKLIPVQKNPFKYLNAGQRILEKMVGNNVQSKAGSADFLVMTVTDNDSNDHEHFMRHFLECQRELLRYVMCFVPNAHDARDIVQNTAVALWKKHADYDSSEPFLPWACRFALNETRMLLRTNQRWKHFLDDETISILTGRRQELTEDLDERRIYLRDCLNALPEKHKVIVEGYYFNDLAVETLANSSGRNIDAIYKSLQRIRSILLECVQRRQQSAWEAGR